MRHETVETGKLITFTSNCCRPGSNGRGTGSIPITATPDVSGGNPYLGGGGPRNIQLAVKFQF